MLPLGAQPALAVTSYTCNGCTYNIGGGTVSYTGLTLTNDGIISNGTLSSSGTMTLKKGSVSATLAGTGDVSKTTADTVTLSGANSYTGGTTVNAGTLTLSGSGTLGSTAGALTVDGGTLALGGTSQTTGAMLLSGGGTISGTGTLTSSSYTVRSGAVGAVLAGSGALTKSGAGTVTLSGANTYTGGTTINAGTLALSGSGTLGGSTGTLAVNGGTLDLGGTSQTTGALSLTGGTISNGTLASSSFGVESGSISATLSGSGGLTKTTNGTVTLSGANTYSGGTSVEGGTLALAGSGTLGTGSVAVSDGTLDLGGTSQTTGALSLTGGTISNGTLASSSFGVESGNISATLAGSGALTKSGTGKVVLTGDANHSGGTTISDGTLQVGDGGTSGTIGGAIVNDGTLSFRRSDAVASDAIVSGSGNLVQAGSGTLTLTGESSYTGATRISNGTLALSGSGSIASSATVNVAGGATFDISGTTDGASIVTLSDSAANGGGTVQLGAQQLTITNASTTFSGTITDGGQGGSLLLSGGDLTLTGVSDYTGGTTVSNGANLYLGSRAYLGSGAITLVDDGQIVFGEVPDDPQAGAPVAQGLPAPTGVNPLIVSGRNRVKNLAGDGSSSPLVVLGSDATTDVDDILVLRGTSTFTGEIEVGDGTDAHAVMLRAGSDGAINSSMDIDVTASSRFDLFGRSASINSLAGEGTVVSKSDQDVTLTLAGTGTSQFAGGIKDGSGDGNIGLTIANGGTLELSGTGLNRYTGATTIAADGTLKGTAEDAFSTNSDVTVEAGATLDVGGYYQGIHGLAGDGTVTSTGAGDGVLAITGKPFEEGVNPIASSFSGNITDGADGTLGLDIRNGTALTLTGDENDYSGTTVIGHGVHENLLIGGKENSFSANSAVEVAYLSSLDVGGYDQQIASLSDGTSCEEAAKIDCSGEDNSYGTVINNGAQAATLTIGGGDDTTFSGTITDGTSTLALSLVDDSTLTLAGIVGYSGGTTVEDGSHLYYASTAEITNDGLSDNKGQMTIEEGATAYLNGGLVNSGTVNNYGTVYDDLTNTGTVNNYGSFNAKLATNNGGATINTSDTWTGNIVNYGTFTASGHLYGATAGEGTIVNGALPPPPGAAAGPLPLPPPSASFTLTGNTDSNGSDFNNAGLLDLADYSFTGLGDVTNRSYARIIMNAPSQTLQADLLTNAGTLSTLDGDTVTNVATIDGDYLGQNGAFLLAVNTVNTTGVRGNVVDITGSAGGTTTLDVVRTGAAMLFAKPITLVDVGGSVSGTPFVLDSSKLDTGFVSYDLLQTAPGQYSLVSHLNGTANGAVTGLGAASLAGSNALASLSLDSAGDLPRGASPDVAGNRGFSVWVHGGGNQMQDDLQGRVAVGPTVTKSDLSTTAQSALVQVGSDMEASNLSDLPFDLHLGITAGAAHVNAKETNASDSSSSMTVPFIGAYGTIEAHDFYIAGQATWQSWSGDLDSGLSLDDGDVTGTGYAAVVEAGYRLALPGNFAIEPSAAFSYGHADFSSVGFDMGEAGHGSLDLGTVESKLGRAGVKLSYGAADAKVKPYVSAALTHDFGGSADSALSVAAGGIPGLSLPAEATSDGDYASFGLGADIAVPDSGVTGYLAIAVQSDSGIDGATASGGLRYSF